MRRVNESHARCDVTYSCMDCIPDVTWFMLTESLSRRDVFDVERVILNERIILHIWISHLTSCMSLIQDVEWVMLNERIIWHMWISHIKSWMGLFQDATCLILEWVSFKTWRVLCWMSLIQHVTWRTHICNMIPFIQHASFNIFWCRMSLIKDVTCLMLNGSHSKCDVFHVEWVSFKM
jgi:hypothetical protein